jgi:AdoMet dependent proline di-methyltransferase
LGLTYKSWVKTENATTFNNALEAYGFFMVTAGSSFNHSLLKGRQGTCKLLWSMFKTDTPVQEHQCDYTFGNPIPSRGRHFGVQETYVNPEQLWKAVEDDKENSWYRPAVEYWDRQEASYNGVLGGYGYVSDADISESTAFLKKAFGVPLQEGARGERHLVAAGDQGCEMCCMCCRFQWIFFLLRHGQTKSLGIEKESS